MREVWKNIKNYEDYQISNFGNIKRLSRKVCRDSIKGDLQLKEKHLKPVINSCGYLRISLTSEKYKRKGFMIDRLVANNFLDNTKNATVIKHIDENKLNNNINNLKWKNPRKRKTEDYNLTVDLEKTKNYKETDFSYIAGLMDADGCFTININRGKKFTYYVPYVQIAQIDKEAVAFIKERFEFNEYTEFTYSVNGSISKPFYRIVMAGLRTQGFLLRVYPYLKIKQKQVVYLIELCELLQNPEMELQTTLVKRKKGNYIANFPVRSKHSIKLQNDLYKKVRKLNGREK